MIKLAKKSLMCVAEYGSKLMDKYDRGLILQIEHMTDYKYCIEYFRDSEDRDEYYDNEILI